MCAFMLAAPSTRTGHEMELKVWAKTHILACSCWKSRNEKMARVQDYPLAQPLRWPSIPVFTVEVGEIQGEPWCQGPIKSPRPMNIKYVREWGGVGTKWTHGCNAMCSKCRCKKLCQSSVPESRSPESGCWLFHLLAMLGKRLSLDLSIYKMKAIASCTIGSCN